MRFGRCLVHRTVLWFALTATTRGAAATTNGAGATDQVATASPEEPSSSWLRVSRSTSAEGCPSAEELLDQTQLMGVAVPQDLIVEVRFEREQDTFTAEIGRPGQEGVRRMSDTHTDCAPLAGAVSTAIALLVDAEPQKQVIAPSPTAKDESASTKETRAPVTTSVGVLLHGGAAFGLTEGVAGLIGGEVFFETGRLRLGIGGQHVFRKRATLDPGGATHQLTAMTAKVCLRFLGTQRLGMFGCSGAMLGALQVEAFGYTENLKETRPWLAVPVELGVGGRWGKAPDPKKPYFQSGWRMVGGAVVPLRQESFTVEGLGTVFETSPVGGQVWAGLEGSFNW